MMNVALFAGTMLIGAGEHRPLSLSMPLSGEVEGAGNSVQIRLDIRRSGVIRSSEVGDGVGQVAIPLVIER